MSSCNWPGGRVADADGAGPPVAVEVVERVLGDVVLAADAVHDLEAGIGLPLVAPVLEPPHECPGLFGEAEAEQGVQAERRVADPRVPVVPVPRPADGLRQA